MLDPSNVRPTMLDPPYVRRKMLDPSDVRATVLHSQPQCRTGSYVHEAGACVFPTASGTRKYLMHAPGTRVEAGFTLQLTSNLYTCGRCHKVGEQTEEDLCGVIDTTARSTTVSLETRPGFEDCQEAAERSHSALAC